MRTFFLEDKIFFEHSLPLKSTKKWPKFYHQIATRPETSLQQITAELLFPYSFSGEGPYLVFVFSPYVMASELELSKVRHLEWRERRDKNYLSFLERFVFESLSLSFDVDFLCLCLCFFFLFFSRFDFLLFCLFLFSSPSLVSSLLSCESLSLVVDSSSNAFSCSILQELEKTFNY